MVAGVAARVRCVKPEKGPNRNVVWDGLTPRHFAVGIDPATSATEDEVPWYDCDVVAPSQLCDRGLSEAELEREEFLVEIVRDLLLDIRVHVRGEGSSPGTTYAALGRRVGVGERRFRDWFRGESWMSLRAFIALRREVPRRPVP